MNLGVRYDKAADPGESFARRQLCLAVGDTFRVNLVHGFFGDTVTRPADISAPRSV
jgi:hypothetical protein